MRSSSGKFVGALGAIALAVISACAGSGDSMSEAEKSDATKPGFTATRAIAEEAYVYAFPMIAAYKALYQFNVDKTSSQYKGPFNTIANDSQVFTYKDTAIVTPNSDTPYSMVQADLRAEPIVLCVPKVDPKRYYSVQLVDMYAQNYGYIGSRATGSDAGCYLLAGPDWKGTAPESINKSFRSETQFSLGIYRTQLFGPDDIANVKKVQSGYTVQTLSKYTRQPAPPAAPAIAWPPFTEDAFKTDFPAYLDFLLQFAPEVPEEAALRARFASIGIGPGKKFDWKSLSLEQKLEIGLGAKDGFAKITRRKDEIGTRVNGWQVGSAFGDRSFYNGDYLLRAAAALAGIYGNDAVEAMYPMATHDAEGTLLDGSKHSYTVTFPAGELPPVNAFWSVTMYDGKTQLLIKNPINRYLINSPMLKNMKTNADGSLSLYIQNKAPEKALTSNWLPAPNGPIFLVMRLYWPKETPPSILPPGEGTWKPPAVVPAK
jgi:hypothetical protein